MAEKCYPEGVLKEEKDLLSAMSSRQDKKLPREIILKSKSEIDRVIKSGKKVTRDSFNVFVRQSEQTRVAFLVSKKIGTAVMRNRMKRLFREGRSLDDLSLGTVGDELRSYMDKGKEAARDMAQGI